MGRIPHFRESEQWVIIELKEAITIKHSMVMNGCTIGRKNVALQQRRNVATGTGNLSHDADNELRSHNQGRDQPALLLLLLLTRAVKKR